MEFDLRKCNSVKNKGCKKKFTNEEMHLIILSNGANHYFKIYKEIIQPIKINLVKK